MSIFKKFLGSKSDSPSHDDPQSSESPPAGTTPSTNLPADFSVALDQHEKFSDKLSGLSVDDLAIDWNADFQQRFVTEILPKWRPEISELLESEHLTAIEGEAVVLDHAVLYSMICENEPSRLIEIGCGRTTHTIRAAFQKHTMPCELIAIDPAPPVDIDEVVDAHMDQPVQEIPLEDFRMLQSGEMLILDLSHYYLPASDVGFVYDRILPILSDGVVVCVMGTPLLTTSQDLQSEGLLLRLFLSGNRNVELIYSGEWAAEKEGQALSQYWEVDPSDLQSRATWFRIKH